jgi:4-hydroxybenzoate polyprenyltransferase
VSPSSQDQTLPDALAHHFILRLTPVSIHPYIQLARLDRPIGWWLLLIPCWWSSVLASVADHASPRLDHLLLFMIGAIAMRGAGCTYNDLIDRDIDARVERTRNRPLPSGRITPRAAKIFLFGQAAIGAVVLFCFNQFAIGMGLASLLIIAVYPFMKRITSWPQAILGLAFAYGGLMGWAAYFGSLAWPALFIYLSAIAWTMGYDTIYALQDARDDAIVGVRSTARLFASHVPQALMCLYGLTFICAGAALVLAHAGMASFFGLGLFVAHLIWQIRVLKLDDTQNALMLFRCNKYAGLLFFAGLVVDSLNLSFALN